MEKNPYENIQTNSTIITDGRTVEAAAGTLQQRYNVLIKLYKQTNKEKIRCNEDGLREILKCFFPQHEILIITENLDNDCFGNSKTKIIKKIKIIKNSVVMNFDYSFLKIKEFLQNDLNIDMTYLISN